MNSNLRLSLSMLLLVAVVGCSTTSPTATAPLGQSPTASTTTPTSVPASPTPSSTLASTSPSPGGQASSSPSASPAGLTLEVFAGGGSETPATGVKATSAALNRPQDVAFAPDGSLWIVDLNLGEALHILADGTIAEIATDLLQPSGVTVAPDGKVYIADRSNQRIATPNGSGPVDAAAGDYHAPGFAGDGGPFASALFSQPEDIASDAAGNLYIDDSFNVRIRFVDAQTHVIDTIVGNGTAGFSGDGGPALAAEINIPRAIAVDDTGTTLLIADSVNLRLRQVDLTTGQIETIMGTGGGDVRYDPALPGAQTPLGILEAVGLDQSGNIYVPVLWSELRLTIVRRDQSDKLTLLAGGGASSDPAAGPLNFALPDVLCLVPNPVTDDLLFCGADGRVYVLHGATVVAGP